MTTEQDKNRCYSCQKVFEDALPLHSCPFSEEIAGDENDRKCNCCPDCEYQCAMDI